MAKILDDRQVEYAYAGKITISPNDEGFDSSKFTTFITIDYVLLDSGGWHLASKQCTHSIDSEGRLDVAGITKLIADNLDALIAADKEKLSDYKP